mgnify:CR=1 FL=1
MRERRTRVSLALVAAALSQGCSKAPAPAPSADAGLPAATVSRVRIHDGTPPDRRPAPLDTAALEAALGRALTEAGLPVRPGARDGWRVSIEARVAYGLRADDGIAATVAPGTAKVTWAVELRLRPPESTEALHAFIEVADEGAFAGADAAALKTALEGHAAAGMQPVVRAIRRQVEVLGRDVAGLVDGLSDPDPDVRRASAGRLGMLRAAASVPALAARVPVEQDREVLLRMIGALAEIGDDRAAEALIGLANPRDRELLRAVVDALSVVGGPRVVDFFDILSSHDAPDVRAMVSQARARLAPTPLAPPQ